MNNTKTCVYCEEQFLGYEIPFHFENLYVHPRHFLTFTECQEYLKDVLKAKKDGEKSDDGSS